MVRSVQVASASNPITLCKMSTQILTFMKSKPGQACFLGTQNLIIQELLNCSHKFAGSRMHFKNTLLVSEVFEIATRCQC